MYWQDAAQPCKTAAGLDGKCRLPTLCIGVDLHFLDTNVCPLAGGEQGACCPPVPPPSKPFTNAAVLPATNQAPPLPASVLNLAATFELPPPAPAQDSVLTQGLEVEGDDNEGDVPSFTNNKFHKASKATLELYEFNKRLLKGVGKVKTENKLSNAQIQGNQANSGNSLASLVNSDTNSALKAECPWKEEPTCNPEDEFRTFDGSCNNLENPNWGRVGTQYQRMVPAEYAEDTVDEPRILDKGR